MNQPLSNAKFFRILQPFVIQPGNIRLERGDTLLRGGDAHTGDVRIATPTNPTAYGWSEREWCNTNTLLAEGIIRPLTVDEFARIEPHLTKRIWLCDTEHGLDEQRRCFRLYKEGKRDTFRLQWAHQSAK